MTTIICGLATAKILSSLVGPAGYGYFALYGTILGIGWLWALLGIQAMLPRLGSPLWAEGRIREWHALKFAALAVTGMVLGSCVLGLVMFRHVIGLIVLHQSLSLRSALLLSLALFLGGTAPIQNSILKSEGKVSNLARADIATALINSALTVGIVAALHTAGIIYAVAASAMVHWLVLYRYAGLPRLPRRSEARRMIAAAASLLRMGIPYTGTSLVANACGLIVPILIVQRLGTSAVGLYAAATTVGGQYLGFFVSIMGRDYYPRLSAISLGHPSFRKIVQNQQEMVLLVGLPLVMLLLAGAPLLIPLIYTPRFVPLVPLLQWIAACELLRYVGATLGYIVLAKLSSRDYFYLESAGGLATLGATMFGLHQWGFLGIGIGYAIGQLVHLVGASVIVRRSIGYSPPAHLQRWFAASLFLLLAERGVMAWIPQNLAIITSSVLTFGVCCVCWNILRNRWRAPSEAITPEPLAAKS